MSRFDPARPSDAGAAATRVRSRAPVLLLLAPDDAIRTICARILERTGCEVRALAAGPFEPAEDPRVDVIVVDADLLGRDGEPLGAIERLLERHPRAGLVVCGYEARLARLAQRRRGRVIARPFRARELEEAVRRSRDR